MKRKKLLSIVIAAMLASNGTTLVLAQESDTSFKTAGTTSAEEQTAKITKTYAKELAKKVLKENFETEIDEAKYQTSIYYRPNYDFDQQGYLWDISWSRSSSEKSVSISVSIDAMSGKVLRVYKNEYSNDQPTISSITEDKAREISDDFLKKVNPEEFKEVQLLPNANPKMYYYSPVNYSFNYIRLINGIKFDSNMLTVEVNGTTGKVVGYSYKWSDNLNLQAPGGIMTSSKAEEAFKNQIKLNLNYKSYVDKYSSSQSEKSVKLIYTPVILEAQLLDAYTGKFTNYNGTDGPTVITKDLSVAERYAFFNSIKPLSVLGSEIDKNRASELTAAAVKELYGDGYEVDSLNYSEDDHVYGSGTGKFWSANFRRPTSKDPKAYESGQIVIDALTESVISLYKYNDTSSDTNASAKYTWEQMYSKAIDALAKYYPDKAKEVKTSLTYSNPQNDSSSKYYPGMCLNYHFERTVNGIQYPDNSIDISFNPITGELVELRCYWDNNITFPETKNVLSSSEGARIFYNVNKPELAYTVTNKSTDYSKPEYEIKLVYRLNNSISGYSSASIDAFSGKFLDSELQEIDDNIGSFKDKIKGLPIEKELTILAAQGVVDTKNFDPANKVTKMELIKMLVNARGYRPGILDEAAKLNFKSEAQAGDVNYKYLQMAVYYGIIENKEGEVNLSETVNREDMAKTLVKLLGYDKLAQAKDIFVLNVNDMKDINPENIGYIAIAKGIGILILTDNNIRPKAEASMGELALGIYQVLGNLRSR